MHNYDAILNILRQNIESHIYVINWSTLKLLIKLEPDFDLYEINHYTLNRLGIIFSQAVEAYSEV